MKILCESIHTLANVVISHIKFPNVAAAMMYGSVISTQDLLLLQNISVNWFDESTAFSDAAIILDIKNKIIIKLPSLRCCTLFLDSDIHLPQGLLAPSIPHHICSSVGLQHKCPSETLSSAGVGGGVGGLQVHFVVEEKLANQGVQTEGLTNHTTEGEGKGD